MQKREYCPQEGCGEIMVKEVSMYYPKIVSTFCFACQYWHKLVECKSNEEAKKMASEYYFLVFKPKPVTTAELKQKFRRKSKRRITVDTETPAVVAAVDAADGEGTEEKIEATE